MRTLVWIAFAVLALLWTGAAWMTSALLGFAADVAVGDGMVDPAVLLSHWALPAWLLELIGVETLHRSLDQLTAVFDALAEAGPWLARLLGWVVPVVWVVWAIGLSILVLLTLLLHGLLKPSATNTTPAAGPPGATG